MEKKNLSLFSKDSLDSIAMAEVLGGDPPNNCNGGNCYAGCGATINGYQCVSKDSDDMSDLCEQ